MRTIKTLLFILALGLPWSSGFAQHYSNIENSEYDKEFQVYSGRYMPAVDWRLLKAQCWQESRFKVDAVSPVGAAGICQFMPATWKDMTNRTGFTGSVFNPKLNIKLAAIYMGQLRNGWSSPRPETDRHSLAMASYNAGFGNILAAQRLCDMSVMYDEIIQCLPDVTKHHSKETIGYVQNIWMFWYQLKF